jgi:ribonuclease BN (tRNA processing enzyme)
MESVFIGTCACNYSKYEHRFSEDLKDNFDNDARRASSLLIENRILLDCGPHASDALHIVGVGPEDITDIVITHLHEDHFALKNIERIASAKSEPLYLWVSEDAELPEIKNVNVKRMKKFETYNLSENIKI